MLKPFGRRVLVKQNKILIKDAKGKPMLNDGGQPAFRFEQKAKVLKSNIPEIKAGQYVFPLLRGEVPIDHLDNKNYQIATIDEEDIYAVD